MYIINKLKPVNPKLDWNRLNHKIKLKSIKPGLKRNRKQSLFYDFWWNSIFCFHKKVYAQMTIWSNFINDSKTLFISFKDSKEKSFSPTHYMNGIQSWYQSQIRKIKWRKYWDIIIHELRWNQPNQRLASQMCKV